MYGEVKEFLFDDVKLFECESVVMDTNLKHPLLYMKELGVDPDVIVPVLGFADSPMGSVSFHRNSIGQIVASIKLEYSCAERLDIEANQVYLEVSWFVDGEGTQVYDLGVEIGWIEAHEARLTFQKPSPDAQPIQVK